MEGGSGLREGGSCCQDPVYHILLLLLSLWRCGQGDGLVHHIHGPPGPVGLGRRSTAKGGMGPLGVVEVDPRADDPFGVEAVGELVQVDRLVLERAPEALDD